MKGTTLTREQLNVRARMILTAVIPALIPWGAVLFYSSLPDVLTKFFLFTKGWLAWTLIEYCMHRWSFHKPIPRGMKDKDPFKHNYHHTHPDNIMLKRPLRILSVGVIIVGISTMFWGPILLTYFAGLLSGLASYILVHWFLHQHHASYLFPDLVKQHIWHHCKYPNKCFGITTIFWDKIFKSLPAEFKIIPENIIQFYYKHEGLEPEVINTLRAKINASAPFARRVFSINNTNIETGN
jgi:sterol desaturase/sphingolipid hydroxylase (fatty acid hydroxylase superfamily)